MDTAYIANPQLSQYFNLLIKQQPFQIVADNARIPSREIIMRATLLDSKGMDRIAPLRRSMSDALWQQKRPSARWRSNSVPPGQQTPPPPRRPSPIFSVRKSIAQKGKNGPGGERKPTGTRCLHASDENFLVGSRWRSGINEASPEGLCHRSACPPNRMLGLENHSCSASDSDLFRVLPSSHLDEERKLRWKQTTTELFDEILDIVGHTTNHDLPPCLSPQNVPFRRKSLTLDQATKRPKPRHCVALD